MSPFNISLVYCGSIDLLPNVDISQLQKMLHFGVVFSDTKYLKIVSYIINLKCVSDGTVRTCNNFTECCDSARKLFIWCNATDFDCDSMCTHHCPKCNSYVCSLVLLKILYSTGVITLSIVRMLQLLEALLLALSIDWPKLDFLISDCLHHSPKEFIALLWACLDQDVKCERSCVLQ